MAPGAGQAAKAGAVLFRRLGWIWTFDAAAAAAAQLQEGQRPNAAAEARRCNGIFSPMGVSSFFTLMRSHQKADAAPPGPSAWRRGKLSSARGH